MALNPVGRPAQLPHPPLLPSQQRPTTGLNASQPKSSEEASESASAAASEARKGGTGSRLDVEA